MVSMLPYILILIAVSCFFLFSPYLFLAKIFDKLIIFGLLIVSIFSFNFIGDAIVKQVFWLFSTFYILYLYLFKYKCLSVVKTSIPWPLFLLVLYCAISIMHSPIFFVSFKRMFLLVAVLLFSSYIVIRKDLVNNSNVTDNVYDDFFYPTFGFVFVGFLYSFLLPSYGFGSDGSMNGFAPHKNIWGFFSFALSFFSFCYFINDKKKKLALFTYVIGYVSVIFSRSTTSLVCASVMSIFLVIIMLRVKYKKLFVVVGLSSLVFCSCVMLFSFVVNGNFSLDYISELFFTSVGKSETLTGRVKLWALMEHEISYHRFFGIGYGGFWNEMDGPSRLVISQLYWGPPSQAHNGYIDIVNEIGFVGLSILFLLLANHFVNILKIWWAGKINIAAPHLIFLISILIFNYTESSILRITNIFWVLLVISIMYIEFIKNKKYFNF